MDRYKSLYLFIPTLLAIAALTTLGPAERSLGGNVRVVYPHGAWVWAALACFAAAALAGLLGLARRSQLLLGWSRALGRAGLFFWISYLPISLWAMQTNWNGLFLAEPRFRLAVIFSVAGVLLQIGLTLLENPAWAGWGNLGYAIILFSALRLTPNVMHPQSPIFTSDAWRVQLFFTALLALTLLLAWQIANWFYLLERRRNISTAKMHRPAAQLSE
jgi:hypothetical protein